MSHYAFWNAAGSQKQRMILGIVCAADALQCSLQMALSVSQLLFIGLKRQQITAVTGAMKASKKNEWLRKYTNPTCSSPFWKQTTSTSVVLKCKNKYSSV